MRVESIPAHPLDSADTPSKARRALVGVVLSERHGKEPSWRKETEVLRLQARP